jgi:hypothetical protein
MGSVSIIIYPFLISEMQYKNLFLGSEMLTLKIEFINKYNYKYWLNELLYVILIIIERHES